MRLKTLVVLIVSILLIYGCGKRVSKTYIDNQQTLLGAYINGDFAQAFGYADTFAKEVEKDYPQDVYVALLERAKVAMDAGVYDKSIKDFQIAEKRFLDIEGTIALSEEGSALFLDDTTKEYEAEPLEKLMISPYLALTYWLSGSFNDARIERNRTMVKINQYIEAGGEETLYLENPFARYISGIIYENEQKFQDAKIEYTKIKKTAPHLAKFIDADLERVKKDTDLSDLVVFVDIGRSPIKFEVKHDPIEVNNVRVEIVYAEMRAVQYNVKKAKVVIDGKEAGETMLLHNMADTVLKQFEENKPKMLKSLIARAAVKAAAQAGGNKLAEQGGTVGAIGSLISLGSKVSSALERADLRSWVTLPAQVQMFRAYKLGAGKHTIKLIYLSDNGNVLGESPQKEVTIGEKQIGVTHFRVVK